MISRSRGYLPHLEISEGTYFLTFRLADSLPSVLLLNLKQELFLKKGARSPGNSVLTNHEYYSKIETLLDKGAGECWLKDPKIAIMVIDVLRYFDGLRYFLHAWTIMPNHVHLLFTMKSSSDLSSIVQSWKGFTAFQANRLLGRTGRFWQPEYFDRLIKNSRQFEFYVRYIFNNPVKAGLCVEVFQWPWSGCSADLQYFVNRFFKLQAKACVP